MLYHETVEHLRLLTDIDKDDRCTLLKVGFTQQQGRIKQAIRRIHLSKKINKIIALPKKFLWYTYSRVLKQIGDYSTLLIFDGAIEYMDVEFFRLAKQRNPDIRICLFLINSYDAGSPVMWAVREHIRDWDWDAIYSFDPDDCRKYGFRYCGFNYYSMQPVKKDFQTENDCYFVGGLKGEREQLIIDTYNYLNRNGVKCDFLCKEYVNFEKIVGGIRVIDQRLPYEQIICDVNKSNCIIEILQKNQNAPSLRYFEAICYNKKLLTTNDNIKQYPYFNNKYMKVFHSVYDIDIEWIKKNDIIDYKYKGDFSPKMLIDFLQKEELRD